MRRTPFNAGWTVSKRANRFEERLRGSTGRLEVTLPHDAMLGSTRVPDASPAAAYYPGGTWEYHRTIERAVGDDDAAVFLDFEGVYRDALVFVNDNVIAHQPNGYAGFVVQIDHLLHDGANDLKVEVRAYDDSRWYSGAGIYRNVWLLEAGRVHLAPETLQVLTPEIDDDVAVLQVGVVVRNQSASLSNASVAVEIDDADGIVVTRCEAPVTTFPGEALLARQRLTLPEPHRWRPDDPYLYRCRVALLQADRVVDREETSFGVRTLSLDSVRGLRINDEPVLLRGACVHHDNGPLGAATIDRAEERRVELLKAAGFNAIRSAHNPLSRAMLTACDRLGVFVMDEAFDMWQQPKSEHDFALHFTDRWEGVIEAMVRKDINHPSVILYSIGNEIPDAGRPQGSRLGRALAEKVRSLDHSRFVTEAVSGFLIGGPELMDEIRARIGAAGQEAGGELGPNTSMIDLAESMNRVMVATSVDKHSAETFSYLDVAGYNYMEARFEIDAELYPNRVMMGSETHPAAIGTGWPAVCRHPQVIGDFTWTGWDYLGEVGIGRTVYGEQERASGMPSFQGEYPWRAAWCGDVDITGQRRPQSYYREIVFGLRSEPYLAVQRPEHHGKVAGSTPWSWSDVVASWTWDGYDGAPVVVEVYADADEVELLVNGRSSGKEPVGAVRPFFVSFDTVFEPGVLEAVAWRDGRVAGRSALRTARGQVSLRVQADRTQIGAHPGDLGFVSVHLVDGEGVRHHTADRRVDVDVEGPGVLQALGSANPVTEEGFGETACTTFEGRALAIVRPTGAGRITVTARTEGCQPQRVQIDAVD